MKQCATKRLLLVLLIVAGTAAWIGACHADNLVFNPGFEIGTLSDLYYGSGGDTRLGPGWTVVFPTTWSYAGSENTHHPTNRTVYEGVESAFIETEGNGFVQYYQDISVVGGAEYTASTYVIGMDLSGTGTGFGAAATDWAGVRCVEYDALGNAGAENSAGITDATTEYVQQSVTFTTAASTVRIRFYLEGKIMCQYPLGRIMFDSAALEGPAPPLRTARFYQIIPVKGGTAYTAGAKFKAISGDPENVVWGNLEDDQTASLYVKEYSANGTAIGSEKSAVAAETGEWETLAKAFTTGANTRFVEVGGYANMVERHFTGSRAVFDSFELNGPAGAAPMDISQVRGLADGSTASVSGQVVTAAFADYFYIESSDRTAGIRVLGKAKAGQLVTAVGTVSTIDGEKTLVPNLVGSASGGTIPRPLGLNNRSAAAPPGLSAVGLYVVAWGRVDAAGGNVFTVTDGSGNAIKVYGPSGFSAEPNSYVRIAAALGSEMAGDDVVPVLRAVSVIKRG